MDKIYYISQGETPKEHLKNIKNVCEAGCKLVQLRLKNTAIKNCIATASIAKKICDSYDAQLIINDSIEVAKAVNASGIHLGKNDTDPTKAKQLVSTTTIIGATANTFEDCIHLINQKVDYIGLGPFKFTNTKNKLSPILGREGYQSILSKLKENGHTIPIFAIGGIVENDFESLLNTGVYGIAVSGLLSNKSIKKIKKIINQCNSISRYIVNTNKQVLQKI